MFLFRRSGVGSSARLRALRALYWSFSEQNTPEARARRLLREWLSPDQRAQFDAESYFEVTGSHTGRRYRIHYGTVSNVVQVDEAGQPETGWCFVPERALAAGDVMLAQKIALETDEMSVLALANRISPNLPRLHRMVRRAH
ncbi:hypothetical protein I6F14_32595 [Bradyrhizobium sp. IC3069]|uniref:hypothetical protein n=1 Tax=unclassified Bradyrhizobium TaxID=2631580 RepID=UPI001CD2AF17|nr:MULTISPECIES: hypothetical protein [unclassified Bradyrhizobium]MCA1365014.1 hypothetical protein [Bradyrhizobium sp. IC4059]MCA1522679.1 hypothetical protein [Bradyrhizobium sp. IC3069]